jgi:hypothetical protein
MNISVTYDDSDVARALSKIIKDENKDEFVKLLTPFLCNNSHAITYFFKLMNGSKLPEIIPNGSLCRILVQNLDYNANKSALLNSELADDEEKVIVRIKEFRGWHEYSNYTVTYTNIHDDLLTNYEETSYAIASALEVIEEI